MSTLLLVAHGSRDPRSSAALAELAEAVRSAEGHRRPVELAFLEFSAPLLEEVAGRLRGEVVVVPLLLAEAFHARLDLPRRLAAVTEGRVGVRVTRGAVLGPSPLLEAAVARRAAGLRAGGCDGILLLGAGSSRRRANEDVDAVAARLGARLALPTTAGFVTRGRALEEAVTALRAAGSRRPGIVPWFLAPGRLLDAGVTSAARLHIGDVARPLADDPALAQLVLERARCARDLPAAA